MDKDKSKFNSNTTAKGKCSKPETCAHLQSLRRQQPAGKSSTRVLHVVDNFQPNRSEDEFFDCLSTGDSELVREAKHCRKNCKKLDSCRSSKSDNNIFDDPEALRAALERVTHGAQMMLKNFEQSKSGCRKPCNASLEITARLITDAKENGPNCRFQGRPVTMKMPLEFDPTTGQLSSKSSKQVACKQSCKQTCSSQQQMRSNTGMTSSQFRQTKYQLSSINSFELDVFAGSCTPTAPVSTHDTQSTHQKHHEHSHVPVTEIDPEFFEEKSPPQSVYDNDSDFTTEVEWVQEPLPPLSETKALGELGEISLKSDIDQLSTLPSRALGFKRYFMALPQHREFSSCAPCRFYPSPIMDEEGNIFCPGNCGCCQCPWKKRSFDDNREHTNIKVCRCVQRGTIFTNYNQRENCSQISDFDFCPCREKAEAKFLELYNCEMWSSPTATRGPEVRLDQIMELMTPTQPHSPCLALLYMRDERPSPQSPHAADASAAAINDNLNISRKMQTNESYLQDKWRPNRIDFELESNNASKNASPTEIRSKQDLTSPTNKTSQTNTSFLFDQFIRSRDATRDTPSQTDLNPDPHQMGNIRYPTNYSAAPKQDEANQSSPRTVSNQPSNKIIPSTATMEVGPSQSMPTIQSTNCQLPSRSHDSTQWYSLDSDSSTPISAAVTGCYVVAMPSPSSCQCKMQSVQNQSIRTDPSLRKCSCNSSTARSNYKTAVPTRSGYAALDIDCEPSTQYSQRSCDCKASGKSRQRSQSLPYSSRQKKTDRSVTVVYCPMRDYVIGPRSVDVEKGLYSDFCSCATDATNWQSARSNPCDLPLIRSFSVSSFAKNKDSCFLTMDKNSTTANATTCNSSKSSKFCGTADATAWNSANSKKSFTCDPSTLSNAFKLYSTDMESIPGTTIETAGNNVKSKRLTGSNTIWQSAHSQRSCGSSRIADTTAWNSANSGRTCACGPSTSSKASNLCSTDIESIPGTMNEIAWKNAKSASSWACEPSTISKASNVCPTDMESIRGTTNEKNTAWKSANSQRSCGSSGAADATAWNSANSERSCACDPSTFSKASNLCSTDMESIPGTTNETDMESIPGTMNETVWDCAKSERSTGNNTAWKSAISQGSCLCGASNQNTITKRFDICLSDMMSVPGTAKVAALESGKFDRSCGTSEVRADTSDWSSINTESCACDLCKASKLCRPDTETISGTLNASAWKSMKTDKSCGLTGAEAVTWKSTKSEKSCACDPSHQSVASKPSNIYSLVVESLPGTENSAKSQKSCGMSGEEKATAWSSAISGISVGCDPSNRNISSKSNICKSYPATGLSSNLSDNSTCVPAVNNNPATAVDNHDMFCGCDPANLMPNTKSSKSQRSCRAIKSNPTTIAWESDISNKTCAVDRGNKYLNIETCSAVPKSNQTTIAWASLNTDEQDQDQGTVNKSLNTIPTTSCSRSVMAQVTCLCSPEQRAVLVGRGGEADEGPPFVRLEESCLECGVPPVNPCLISATDIAEDGGQDYQIYQSQFTEVVFMQADRFCDCQSSSNTSIAKGNGNEDSQSINQSPRNGDEKATQKSNSNSCDCSKKTNRGFQPQSRSQHPSTKSAVSCSCSKEPTDYTSTRSQQTRCSCNIMTSKYDSSMQGYDSEPENVGVVMNSNKTVCVDKATFDKISSMYKNESSRTNNSAKDRLYHMVDLVTNAKDAGVNLGEVAQQIVRELSLLLRKVEEKSKPPKISYEECMEAVQKGEKLGRDEYKTIEYVNQMQCLDRMDKYLQECFPPQKKTTTIEETEIVAFEIDPDFNPYRASPASSEPEPETRDIVQFASCFTEVDTRCMGSCITEDNESKQLTPKRGSGGEPSMKDVGSNLSAPIAADITSDKLLYPFASADSPEETREVSLASKYSSQPSEAAATRTVSRASKSSPRPSEGNETAMQARAGPIEAASTSMLSKSSPRPSVLERKETPIQPSAGPHESSRLNEASPRLSQFSPTKANSDSAVPCNNELCPALAEPNSTDKAYGLCELDANDPLSPLTDRERLLCEYLLRRMCELCDEDQEMDGDLEEDNYGDRGDQDRPPPNQPCLCCHCRALDCENQCKTVSKALDSAMYDPVAEMKFFIDSVVFDLQAMEHVLNKNQINPKSQKPSPCMGNAPGESFPVTITDVSSLGCRALYVRWELQDCSGVGGYEIYVDGHLTNRFFSHRHEAGVISNVDVSKRHQIILRAQAIGQEFPGEESANCNQQAIINAHPEMLVGAQQPWSPSVYFYEP